MEGVCGGFWEGGRWWVKKKIGIPPYVGVVVLVWFFLNPRLKQEKKPAASPSFRRCVKKHERIKRGVTNGARD